MRQHILTAAALAIAISSQGMAQSGASRSVTEANDQTAREIAAYASQDFDDARRGFIATIDSPAITNDDGTTCYDIAAWDFLDGEAPATVNPSLWRQSMLNSINGLFEVVKGKIYQVRGFDIANMTFVRSDDGWIIIDATSADGAAKAGYDLVKKHLGNYPVKAIILTHPHGDHFGGIGALIDGAPNDDYEIIVPRGFLHEAQSENIIAGVATGAIACGVLTAEELGKPFIYVRSAPKDHGMANQVEGYYEPGAKVVVVEDLISTGGSSLKAVEALRNAGCEVLGMVAIFTYGFPTATANFEKAGVELETLSNYNTLIELAAEQNYIKPEEMETLREWRKSPDTWNR